MIWVALVPAATEPQFIDVMLTVHSLSENAPRLGDVMIVPDEGTFLLTLRVAIVIAVSADATTINATTNIKSFETAILMNLPSCLQMWCAFRLNKSYFIDSHLLLVFQKKRVSFAFD